MRGISEEFMLSLKNGLLHPVLACINNDETLMLGIRDGYVNVYYRGGILLRITEKHNYFDIFFDRRYDISKKHDAVAALQLPEFVTEPAQIEKVVSSVPPLKECMNLWFAQSPKMERECQQLAARENNRSPVSDETSYFITDIEFADSGLRARFDMLAVKWPVPERGDGKKCTAAIIEMKHGDDALTGKTGLLKHLDDAHRFFSTKGSYQKLLKIIASQFHQLDDLGLLRFDHSKAAAKIKLNELQKPELIFIIANHDPRSATMADILRDPAFIRRTASDFFDVRFFIGTTGGYGMHGGDLLSREAFLSRLLLE